MHDKRLSLNTLTSLLLQIVTIICGFILPRLILGSFGSEVNGLVNSITQFLSIIAFLDLGVGAVFQSSLYKPFADNDNSSLSKIFVSGQKFFARLAGILAIYVVMLICIYPIIAKHSFSFFYTSTLILVMSISSFAQYYYGMANGLFLTANQRGYILYSIQIITLLLNTIACYVLIRLGATIHIVKLVTSLLYLIRPLFLNYYVKHNYQLDYKIKYEGEPITQKWNGLAQHITSVVLDSTDTVVLTLFSSFANVSIYSVYYLVIAGLRQLFTSTTNGIQALIGDLYAKNSREELIKVFSWTEWIIHTTTTFVFGCALMLIIPFVLIYTNGITDADYNQPLFSALLVLAYAAYCYRLPYHIVIKAGVHFKQTQNCYIVAAVLNIVISIVSVKMLGLVGVAIGTLLAMVYQTIWMAWYDSKHIIAWPFKRFLKQFFIDVLSFAFGILATHAIEISNYTYFAWLVMAIRISFIWLFIIILVNSIFYREMLSQLINKTITRVFNRNNR